jgi:hypothetical protein
MTITFRRGSPAEEMGKVIKIAQTIFSLFPKIIQILATFVPKEVSSG